MPFSLIIAHIGRKARNGHGQNGTGKRIGTHGKRPKSALHARAAITRPDKRDAADGGFSHVCGGPRAPGG